MKIYAVLIHAKTMSRPSLTHFPALQRNSLQPLQRLETHLGGVWASRRGALKGNKPGGNIIFFIMYTK